MHAGRVVRRNRNNHCATRVKYVQYDVYARATAGEELAAGAGAGGPEAYPTASRPRAAAAAPQASAVGTSALVLALVLVLVRGSAGGRHGRQRASSIALVARGVSGPPLALHASLPSPAPSEPRQASSCERLSSLREDARTSI